MAKKDVFVHKDHNGQEVQNVSYEVLTGAVIAALTGVALYQGRFVYNSTTNHVNVYDGTQWVEIVKASDLNRFGQQIGGLSAAAGLPDGTTAGQIGSGVDELGVSLSTVASIQAGDTWVITTPGTIVGIEGDDVLSNGDLLMALTDGAAVAANFVGINMNINDNASQVKTATLTAPLVAATPLSFAAVMAAVTPVALTDIKSVQVINDANGEDITDGLRVDWTATEVESNIAIASVTISIIGE